MEALRSLAQYSEQQPPQQYFRRCQSGGCTKKTLTSEPRKNLNENCISIKSIHQCRTSDGAHSGDITKGTTNSAQNVSRYTKNKKISKNENRGNKSVYTRCASPCDPRSEKTPKIDIRMKITVTHKYNTCSSTNRFNHVTNFKNEPKFFQEEATERIKTHIGTY